MSRCYILSHFSEGERGGREGGRQDEKGVRQHLKTHLKSYRPKTNFISNFHLFGDLVGRLVCDISKDISMYSTSGLILDSISANKVRSDGSGFESRSLYSMDIVAKSLGLIESNQSYRTLES